MLSWTQWKNVLLPQILPFTVWLLQTDEPEVHKQLQSCLLNIVTVSHHHNDDHGACEHAGQPCFFWKVGLFDPRHWVRLHSWGLGCKLWPRTLLREHSDDISLSGNMLLTFFLWCLLLVALNEKATVLQHKKSCCPWKIRRRLCIHPCIFVCQQDNIKTAEQILMRLAGRMQHRSRKNSIHFGAEPWIFLTFCLALGFSLVFVFFFIHLGLIIHWSWWKKWIEVNRGHRG